MRQMAEGPAVAEQQGLVVPGKRAAPITATQAAEAEGRAAGVQQ